MVASQSVKAALHRLNAEIQQQPERKREVIQAFYLKIAATDPDLADTILIVRSINEAGGNMQQTEHLRTARPIFLIGIILAAVLSLAAMGGGIWSMYLHAQGSTDIHAFGFALSTQNVGIAFAAAGLITFVLTIRAAFSRLSYQSS